jgi:hypothetical protein
VHVDRLLAELELEFLERPQRDAGLMDVPGLVRINPQRDRAADLLANRPRDREVVL